MPLDDGQRFIFKAIKSYRVKTDALMCYLFASKFIADKVTLDAACGIGFGTFFLAQEAKDVWGIDFSAEAIDYAKKNYSRENIKFLTGDLLNFKLPDVFFDVITSFYTLEQVNNPEQLLDNFRRALMPDGLLILSTPNKKVVSPFKKKPIGEFNKFEFYKKDLEKMFADKFKIEWYGQRCVFSPLTNYFVRRFVRLIEVVFKKNFDFYGRRESCDIKPLNFWRQPKGFIIVLKKIK